MTIANSAQRTMRRLSFSGMRGPGGYQREAAPDRSRPDAVDGSAEVAGARARCRVLRHGPRWPRAHSASRTDKTDSAARAAGSRAADSRGSGDGGGIACGSDLLPEFFQGPAQLRIIDVPRGAAQPHNDIHRRQVLLVLTKALANESADAVALHRPSHQSCRHRESETRIACAIGLNHGRKTLGVESTTLRIQTLEVGGAAQASLWRQTEARDWGAGARAHGAAPLRE